MARTHRREYTGSRRFDRSCRSHGSCPYCAEGRQHTSRRRAPADQDEQIREGYQVTEKESE